MTFSVMAVDEDRSQLLMLSDYVKKTEWLDDFIPVPDPRKSLEEYSENKPDIVIVSLVLPIYDGFEIAETIKEHDPTGKTIIVLYAPVVGDFVVKQSKECGIDHIFSRPVSYEVFESRLNELISERYTNKTDVAHMLFKMGISPRLKGYTFLKYAIARTCKDATLTKSLSTKLYPDIAQNFGTTVACVERNIRHAVESAWVKGDVAYIDRMFGYTIDANKGKPTNAEFIAMLTDTFSTKQNIID